jgi:glycosyltransferase involved in cell wall biosynthesis
MDRLPDGEVVVLAPAEMPWERLVLAADALLITADGQVEMNAALHAMAAGVPVVGTPVDAVREVIIDGVNGLVSKELKPRSIAARVEDLLRDAVLRKKVVSGAKATAAERFSLERMIDQIQDILSCARV